MFERQTAKPELMDGPDFGPQEVAGTFPDEQVPSLLKRLLAMGRYKLVVNDLIRSPVAYLATWLFTLPTLAVFRHDARLSVRRGFTLGELERL